MNKLPSTVEDYSDDEDSAGIPTDEITTTTTTTTTITANL